MFRSASYCDNSWLSQIRRVCAGTTGPRLHGTEEPLHKLLPTKQTQNLYLGTAPQFSTNNEGLPISVPLVVTRWGTMMPHGTPEPVFRTS
jgi:hypothetical protein